MRKRTVRVTVLFFSILLLLTFFSRTIYRQTLPKVRSSKPSGGTLQYSIDIDAFNVCANSVEYENIPFELTRLLTIEKVFVKLAEQIEIGDSLVAFYATEGEQLYRDAKVELLSAKDAWTIWDVALEKAKTQLVGKLDEAQSREDISNLQNERNLLIAGIYNDTSTRIVHGAMEAAQKKVDYLTALQDNGWILKSQTTGVVCSLSVKEGSIYSGVSPICRIAPVSEPLILTSTLSQMPNIHRGNWVWTAYLDTSNGFVKSEILNHDRETIDVSLPEGTAAADIFGMTIHLESPYQQILVPNSAIRNKKVYLLTTTTGGWGQTVYRVRQVSVIAGDIDDENTSVINGLSRNDRIITDPPKDLTNDQIVLMDDYE